jgi:hypothetical protein
MTAVIQKALTTRSTEPMQASEPEFNAANAVGDLQQLDLVSPTPDIAIVRRGR